MSEKTEQPTPKKLKDAKKDGQVAKSKEIVSLAMLLAVMGYFYIFGTVLLEQIMTLFSLPTHFYDRVDNHTFNKTIGQILLLFLLQTMKMLAPLLSIVFLTGIISNLVQSGWIMSAKPIKPELKKISPKEGAKKIFSFKNLMEFIKSLIKIIVLSYTAYFILTNEMKTLMAIPHCGAACAFTLSGSLVFKLILYCLGVFIFLAAADYLLEMKQHKKQLMMSHDEVKREYKEMEGSPEIKGRRKQLHQELMEEQVEARVKSSDVIVTNPTRIAVGLKYDATAAPLPYVTIKGELLSAKKIRTIAEKHGVPVIRQKYLARGLFAKVEMDNFITEEYIEAVADIIRFVRSLDNNHSEEIESDDIYY